MGPDTEWGRGGMSGIGFPADGSPWAVRLGRAGSALIVLATLAIAGCGGPSEDASVSQATPPAQTGAAPPLGPDVAATPQTARDWAAPGPAPVDGSGWLVPPPFYAAGDEP
jgi:hypothetical protein